MSDYLDLAKRLSTEISPETSREELASRRRRKLEEAGRRGLVVRWSEYPDWIALHDPLTGEWVEVRARDCFPSLVEEANRGARRRDEAYEKTKETKKGGAEWKSQPESVASPHIVLRHHRVPAFVTAMAWERRERGGHVVPKP